MLVLPNQSDQFQCRASHTPRSTLIEPTYPALTFGSYHLDSNGTIELPNSHRRTGAYIVIIIEITCLFLDSSYVGEFYRSILLITACGEVRRRCVCFKVLFRLDYLVACNPL